MKRTKQEEKALEQTAAPAVADTVNPEEPQKKRRGRPKKEVPADGELIPAGPLSREEASRKAEDGCGRRCGAHGKEAREDREEAPRKAEEGCGRCSGYRDHQGSAEG